MTTLKCSQRGCKRAATRRIVVPVGAPKSWRDGVPKCDEHVKPFLGVFGKPDPESPSADGQTGYIERLG